ncbi:MAG: 1-deoxy-D-xylulose-5-phosphate reductoisomerase [bacterium]|nr:1-deoxy-D-xylulose-5-phosphate reductoisomerase [bacterium]
MRTLALLGSTGSIGRQALEVVDSLTGSHPFQVVALAAARNAALLLEQARKYRPELVALVDPAALPPVAAEFRALGVEVRTGPEGVLAAARLGANLVLNAVVGVAGLEPTLAALAAGSAVALANKESLVAGGSLVAALLDAGAGPLVPVDSEPSAVLQCLQGDPTRRALARVILTASGGPFRGLQAVDLDRVTPARALAHPTWNMGPKITVDSATLMNKGLEVIEISWLFRLRPDQVRVVIHPQSIVHSMVELADGSFLAQLGLPDMRVPIQYALTYPERAPAPWPRYDPVSAGLLGFEEPDAETFPCLRLAYEAVRMGGTAPAALSAANEVAVEEFLAGRLAFTGIGRVVEETLRQTDPSPAGSLEAVLAADRLARRLAGRLAGEDRERGAGC